MERYSICSRYLFGQVEIVHIISKWMLQNGKGLCETKFEIVFFLLWCCILKMNKLSIFAQPKSAQDRTEYPRNLK